IRYCPRRPSSGQPTADEAVYAGIDEVLGGTLMTMTEFVRNLPDIPRIITALAEWLACLVCILPLRRRERIRGGTFAAVSCGALAVQCIFMVATDGFEGVMWNLCMGAAAV